MLRWHDITWLYDIFVGDTLLLQILIVSTIVLLLRSNQIYYSLLYLFYMIFLCGLFIAFYQVELFTGFLWVAECTIVLVLIVLLIYLNTDGFIRESNNYFKFYYYYSILGFILLYSYSSFNTPTECSLNTDYSILWDDFYESLQNSNMNDFSILFLCYYNINSLELVFFAILLLVGTLICVTLFKSLMLNKIVPYWSFFSMFNFKKLAIEYNFLRQQDLHKQTQSQASTRLIYKKIN